jgi:hypothetical protein
MATMLLQVIAIKLQDPLICLARQHQKPRHMVSETNFLLARNTGRSIPGAFKRALFWHLCVE